MVNDRDIFRGKRVDNSEWVTGSYLDGSNISEDWALICPKATISIRNELGDLGGDGFSMGSFYFIDPATIGRCTGFKDKHGKLIFKGDIIRPIYDEEYIFIVKFGKCGRRSKEKNYGYEGFYFEAANAETKKCAEDGLRDDIHWWLNECECEIIGNIHDNPELMDAEK